MNKDLYRKILYGGIIGDAMGVPYEFRFQNTFKAKPKMMGYGTYNQPPGTWSDDTSLTLLLMQCLSEKQQTEYFIKLLNNYYYDGYMTPDNECFDIGNATIRAMNGNPDFSSLGNGALMRALPLVYYTWDMSSNQREKEITKWSQVTHPNKESSNCCITYVNIIRELIISQNKEDLTKYIEINKFIPGSNGKVTDTLKTAIWGVLSFNSYDDIILNVINLGGDTDTNAMVAGTMAAAIYQINENWKEQLREKEKIESVINKFLN